MTLPRVYCASPAHRAKMWREDMIPALYGGAKITIVSTWHNNPNLDADDQSPDKCRDYWELDFAQIRQADCLLAYAESKDHPNGTLVEIGYALGMDTPIMLVGNFGWGTWRHSPHVKHYASLRLAIQAITGVPVDDTSQV